MRGCKLPRPDIKDYGCDASVRSNKSDCVASSRTNYPVLCRCLSLSIIMRWLKLPSIMQNTTPPVYFIDHRHSLPSIIPCEALRGKISRCLFNKRAARFSDSRPLSDSLKPASAYRSSDFQPSCLTWRKKFRPVTIS